MRRRAQGDGVLPARDEVAHAFCALQHEGERPGPEAARKRVCGVRNIARPFRELSRIRHMHDEGVIVRAPLGREDLPYRGVIGGIRAEAIHGFGRKGDEPARAQQDHPTVDVRV